MKQPLPSRPERVKIAGAVAITGESARTLQALAKEGRIPGAEKQGGQWTFDEDALRGWVEGTGIYRLWPGDAVRLVRFLGNSLPPEAPVPDMLDSAAAAQCLGILADDFLELVRRRVMPPPQSDGLWSRDRVASRWSTLRHSSRAYGSIYVVGFDRYIKIGFTGGESIASRMRGLQSGVPKPLQILEHRTAPKIEETALLCAFFDYRTSGEWHAKNGDVRRWVERGCPRL